jgi:hypothetical protein
MTINLTIKNSTTSSFPTTSCGSYTVPSGDETYTTSGTRNDTIPNSVGCDSIMTITMTINSLPVVTLSGNNAFCTGDSTLLTGTSGGTSQWYMNGVAINGATSNTYYAAQAGLYNMTKTNLNGCSDSSAVGITVTVNPLPTVTYVESQTMACVNWPAITLTAGSPANGTYSGTAVTGNMFDPAAAGAGTFDIIYTFTDVNGCTSSDTSTITVGLCTGTDELGNITFAITPNPGSGIYTISTLSVVSEITVTDVLGKIVMRVVPTAASTTIDIRNEMSGVYFVKITADGKQSVRRLILNK